MAVKTTGLTGYKLGVASDTTTYVYSAAADNDFCIVAEEDGKYTVWQIAAGIKNLGRSKRGIVCMAATDTRLEAINYLVKLGSPFDEAKIKEEKAASSQERPRRVKKRGGRRGRK